MADPVTRQIGNMSVKFVGDDAARNAAMFDSLMAKSPEFRARMAQTAIEFGRINDPPRTSIYIGSTIDDLKSVPNLVASDFSRRVDPNHPGYGNFVDQSTWAIVLGNRPATLSLDDKTYPSSLELQMAHEFLHPLQRIKDLQSGASGDSSEKTVQNQEQDIAQQLGYKIGTDFPDVQAADHGYDVAPSRGLNPPATFAPPASPPLPPRLPLPPPTVTPPGQPPPSTFGPSPWLPPRSPGPSLPPPPSRFASWPNYGPPQTPPNVALSDVDNVPPRRGPNQGWSSGSSEAPASSGSLLVSQPFSPTAISPGARPPENDPSSSALAAQAPDAWPLPGNGILSGLSRGSAGGGILGGLMPAAAWPSAGSGILGALGPALAGASAPGRSEGNGDPSWAQMLQDVLLRRMRDDPYPDDGNR